MTLSWRLVDGVPECVGVALSTDDPYAQVTDALMRTVRVAKLIAVDRGRHSAPRRLRASKRERYERVAAVYNEAIGAGRPPVRAVAQSEGLSQGGASALVVRVREAGFLPPTSAGVAMGGNSPG